MISVEDEILEDAETEAGVWGLATCVNDNEALPSCLPPGFSLDFPDNLLLNLENDGIDAWKDDGLAH